MALILMNKFNFYYTTDVACGEKYGLSGPGIALTRKFEESPLQFSGIANSVSVIDFAKDNMMQSVWTLDNDEILPFRGDDKMPALVLFSEDEGEAY